MYAKRSESENDWVIMRLMKWIIKLMPKTTWCIYESQWFFKEGHVGGEQGWVLWWAEETGISRSFSVVFYQFTQSQSYGINCDELWWSRMRRCMARWTRIVSWCVSGVERASPTCSLSAFTHSPLVRLIQLFVARNASFTRRRPSTTPAAPPASITCVDVVSLKTTRWGLALWCRCRVQSLCVPFYRPLTGAISERV